VECVAESGQRLGEVLCVKMAEAQANTRLSSPNHEPDLLRLLGTVLWEAGARRQHRPCCRRLCRFVNGRAAALARSLACKDAAGNDPGRGHGHIFGNIQRSEPVQDVDQRRVRRAELDGAGEIRPHFLRVAFITGAREASVPSGVPFSPPSPDYFADQVYETVFPQASDASCW
jgi:hypothetical protein